MVSGTRTTGSQGSLWGRSPTFRKRPKKDIRTRTVDEMLASNGVSGEIVEAAASKASVSGWSRFREDP